MTTTTETYLSTQTSFTNESTTTANNDDPSSTSAANVTIDELVHSCCSEVLPPSSSQLNSISSSTGSPTHLVRFVHSQSSLVSQIDEQQQQQQPQRPSEQATTTSSSHDTPVKQPSSLNGTRLPSPLKPTTIIESSNSMQNTTNLSNITANNISVNNYNVNIHTTNVQQPQTNLLTDELLTKKCSLDEKQTTDIVSQILKNIKEVDTDHPTSTTTNYNIRIDSFNFSSTNEQQHSTTTIVKKSRTKKEAKALTRIIGKDESTSPSFSRAKKTTRTVSQTQLTSSTSMEFIPVPYGWQRRILASDLVVYLR